MPENSGLEHISLFGNVNTNVLDKVKPYFSPLRSCAAGEILMNSEERGTHVLFLFDGGVRLSLMSEDGQVISYRDIGPHEYFGWLSALDDGPRITLATVTRDARISSVKREDFQKILMTDPVIHQNFLKQLGSLYRGYIQRMQDMTLLSAEQRIKKELMRRACVNGNPVHIESHEDLASWTGTARETATRTLKALERSGFVKRHKHSYQISETLVCENWFAE